MQNTRKQIRKQTWTFFYTKQNNSTLHSTLQQTPIQHSAISGGYLGATAELQRDYNDGRAKAQQKKHQSYSLAKLCLTESKKRTFFYTEISIHFPPHNMVFPKLRMLKKKIFTAHYSSRHQRQSQQQEMHNNTHFPSPQKKPCLGPSILISKRLESRPAKSITIFFVLRNK